jgi:hypothetical protein
MLLVVFGAGASFDSVSHFPVRDSLYEEFRPPLANELFADRTAFVEAMQRFSDCLPLITLLRGNVQVEQQLAKFQEQAKTYHPRHRQLAAIRYYLHFMLWNCQDRWRLQHKGITNYATLIDEIERWRVGAKEQVCFVTFNYDTMLEEAMEQVLQFHISDLKSYINQENYTLIKLHGSMNWGRVIEAGFPPPPIHTQQQLIQVAADLKISDDYTLVPNYPMLSHDQRFIFPALAIPIDKKDSFECPQEQVTILGNLIRRVTKVMTLGWRATETRFLEMLRSQLTGLTDKIDLLIVSGSPEGATETFKNLDITVSSDRYGTLSSGFTGLINDLATLDAFLRQSPWQSTVYR